MAPVFAAAVAVAVLGLLQVSDALAIAKNADRAHKLARAAGAIASVAHEVASEFVETGEAKRPGHSPTALASRQAVTDTAVGEFMTASESIRASVLDLADLSSGAERALSSLPYARAIAQGSPEGSAEVAAYYDEILTSLLAVADALPAQMMDTRLIELSRSVAVVAELDRLAALQLDLVMRGLTTRALQPGDVMELAEWVGRERVHVDSLANLEPARQLYSELTSQTPVVEAGSIRQIILDGRGAQAALSADPQTWFSAQSQRLSGLAEMRQELARQLDAEATTIGAAARERTYVLGGLAALIVAVTLTTAMIMGIRTSRRLRRTRYAALTAARIELPTAISNVTTARDAATVHGALTGSSARIDSMLTPGQDEVGELAAAFGAVHRQALRLAADQALLRMEVQAMFVALSRRGQTLVQRQIHLIDEFGRNEADPDALARLFALDHIAARMRRNEENLLVLAGGEPGRWINRPVGVSDLVRAAAQETEEYRRIEIVQAPMVAVAARAAGDAIHLLAELLENATSFSPPSTMVRVSARHDDGQLIITVVDHGIGMQAKNLLEANDRLTRPSALTSTLVGTMGLLVVARLAQRHGIDVRLASVGAGGTTATVTLPEPLLAPYSPEDRMRPARRLWDPRAQRQSLPTTTDSDLTPQPAPTSAEDAAYVPGQRPPAALEGGAVAAVAGSVSVAITPAGLPRRPAENSRLNVPTGAPDGAARLLPPPLPDPEAVRARLSSLAGGLAAAHARPEAPTPPSHARTAEHWRDPAPPAVPRPRSAEVRT